MSWIRIPLKTPENFQVHVWENSWDCPTSIGIFSSIHLSTTLHKRFFHWTYLRQILPQHHRNTWLCCFHYDCSLLCYEFPESTPLDEYLKNKKVVLNLDTLLVVAVDLIDAIQCLENRGIVHNNITMSTVLIAEGFRVSNKSLDFFLFYVFFFFI